MVYFVSIRKRISVASSGNFLQCCLMNPFLIQIINLSFIFLNVLLTIISILIPRHWFCQILLFIKYSTKEGKSRNFEIIIIVFFPSSTIFRSIFFSNKQVHKSQEKFLRKITRQWFIVLMRYMKISELWRNHRKDTFSNFNNHYIFSVSFCFQIQDESENIRKIHT